MRTLTKLDHSFLWHPFTQMQEWMQTEPVIIESGVGAVLRDVQGKEYLDANSSIWTNLHGHQHPLITSAIKTQLDRIAHSSFLGLSNVPAIQLAEKLTKLTGLNRVFYSDDGSTAMEAGIKMALQYWRGKRTKFVGFTGAYHGDTIGAVSVSGIDLFHKTFRPLTFDVIRAARLEDLPDRPDIAAVVIEPLIQGAAGIKLWPTGMLRALRAWCDRTGTLLITDEVLTGFGRTGKMFACEHEGVKPDIMAVAKGLTGGYLPLAATLTTEQIFNAFLGEYREFKTFFHGHSYTGNQLGCAAALANLRVFETERTLEKLSAISIQLSAGLESVAKLPGVKEVRQLGCIGAVEIGPYPVEDKMGFQVCDVMRQHGVLTRPIGNVIVILPPYCITAEQIERIFAALRAGLSAIRVSGTSAATLI